MVWDEKIKIIGFSSDAGGHYFITEGKAYYIRCTCDATVLVLAELKRRNYETTVSGLYELIKDAEEQVKNAEDYFEFLNKVQRLADEIDIDYIDVCEEIIDLDEEKQLEVRAKAKSIYTLRSKYLIERRW